MPKIAKADEAIRQFTSSAIAVLVQLILSATATFGATSASTPPNFVLVLTDDQGWTGTSVSMSRARNDARSDYHLTPNLEQLAQRGMRFSQGYAPASICSPTRRSIQFGQTPARQGDRRFAKNYPTNSERMSIPRLLKSVNPDYQAAHFGKWDIRTDLLPSHLGYDISDGNTGNGEGNLGASFKKKEKWTKTWVTEDPKRIFSVTSRATQFMEAQVSAGRPFFLQVSHYAVHAHTQTTKGSLQHYERIAKGDIHHRPSFAAMTADLDEGLGRLLSKIEELGIQDNTYVIYLADNGAVPWVPPKKEKHLGHPALFDDNSTNFPLRGGKWTLFEGGIRVPLIVAGPGVAPNSWCEVPVVAWDFLPTIADLAGYRSPMPADIDGASFRTLMENNGAGEVSRGSSGLVFHRYSSGYPHSAIRVGDYKLVKFWKQDGIPNDRDGKGRATYEPLLLFNIREDLGETQNLAHTLPEKVEQLEVLLDDYLKHVQAEILD